MAKFIWWLTVFVTCIVNSVSPFHMQQCGFLVDKYYTGDMNEDPEAPWTIYKSFFTSPDELYQPCNPKPYNIEGSSGKFRATFKDYWKPSKDLNGKSYVFAIPSTISTEETGAIDTTKLVYDESGTKLIEDANDVYGKRYNLLSVGIDGIPSLIPLIAPIDCELVTSIDKCDHSTIMEIEGVLGVDTYTFSFINMECWFCDYNHGTYDGANYKHCAVEDEDYASCFAQGQVLGIANADTRVSVEKNGEQISLTDFYALANPIVTTLDGSRVFPEPEESSES